jgi:hypothetical protein
VFRAKAWVLSSQGVFVVGLAPGSAGLGVDALACCPGGFGLGGLGLKARPRPVRAQSH